MRGIRHDGGLRVHVEVVGPEGDPALPADVLEPLGARFERSWRNRTETWIPLDRVVEAAQALPDGYRIEAVAPLGYDDVKGEGPTVLNSASYRDGGADGSGLTIAVIDGGYNGLTAARTNGDAPPTGVTTQINYTTTSFESAGDGTHGTGCVETAYDHCPGATWRLYKIDSVTDLGTAVSDAITAGVDVITQSLSWYNKGWNDDSGSACAAANTAAAAGILWFSSAGNRQQQHWQGSFEDGPDTDDWHDWASGDELLDVVVAAGASGSYYLSWDTATGSHDYDLYLFDASTGATLASSTNGGMTFESFTWTNSSSSGKTVQVAVQNKSGTTTEMELFLHGTGSWQEYIVSSGSTTSPSNSTNDRVISVGAVAWGSFGSPPGTTGILKNYSSNGPSNDGMTLPDLIGPTDTTNFTYGIFTGTSCATPNVAGAATAFWSAHPQYDASAIDWLLDRQAEEFYDWGASGADDLYGKGGVWLYPFAPDTLWVSREYGNVLEQTIYPYFTVTAAESAAVSGGRLLLFPGGSYPEVITTTKALTMESVAGTAELGS